MTPPVAVQSGPLERDPERDGNARGQQPPRVGAEMDEPPRQAPSSTSTAIAIPDVIADDEVDDPVPEAAHAVTTVGVRASSRAKRSDHATVSSDQCCE